ncbi:MAG: hypothetical protein ACOC5E_02355 [Acidobacteriota bacterium]
MRAETRERLQLVLIGSTIVAALLVVVFGIPRVRGWLTPEMHRVRVASAALGRPTATMGPRVVQDGVPVTLYAIVEATPWGADEPVLFGTVDAVEPVGGGESLPVREWKAWWYAPEFLWFKVEPTHPFANPEFDSDFRPEQIEYTDNYQVTWGFDWSHAADISPTADAYPDWSTGTMRFAARAVIRDWRDRILDRAPGIAAEAVHAPEPRQRPLRLTVRGGEDAFGILRGFAGLPYVPLTGRRSLEDSAAGRYVGGTVLTFWLASLHELGAWSGPLIDWEELPDVAEVVVEEMFLANDGTYYFTDDPLRPVTWEEVRAGDLLVIEDHVGVLFEDRGPGGGGDGRLNRWDRALEAYFEPLRDNPLGDAFVSGITVYRLEASP